MIQVKTTNEETIHKGVTALEDAGLNVAGAIVADMGPTNELSDHPLPHPQGAVLRVDSSPTALSGAYGHDVLDLDIITATTVSAQLYSCPSPILVSLLPPSPSSQLPLRC